VITVKVFPLESFAVYGILLLSTHIISSNFSWTDSFMILMNYSNIISSQKFNVIGLVKS